jgi:signal transduction histidine kinase
LEAKSRDLAAHRDQLARALSSERAYSLLQREFVTMVSHEFRTPLAIIDSTAQRILRRMDRLTREELGQRVDKIRGSVTRMTGLIESTLSESRREAGTIRLNPEPCDIVAVVAEACRRQQEIAESHRISMDIDGLPREVFADSKLLDQICSNLLSNAVKYAPDNPDIEVTGWTEGEQAVFSVRDHGLGISADELPKLFQRYFRAKTAAGIAGTGIGLNLVKQLVRMHGGSIDVESVEGEGTTFTVRLPIDSRIGAAKGSVASICSPASYKELVTAVAD